MARQYLGYTQRGLTSLFGLRSAPDDNVLIYLEDDEAKQITMDFTDYLDAGETVQSASVTIEGSLSSTSPVATSPTVSLTLSGANAWGRVTVLVTMSSGVVVNQKIEARNRLRYIASEPIDYLEHPHWVN